MNSTEVIVKVYNYVPVVEGSKFNELSSFKGLLRNTFKTTSSDVYFSKCPNSPRIKNMGCYLFGQPRSWDGILKILYKGHGVDNVIDIVVKKWISEITDAKIKDMLKPVLEYLQEHGYIYEYEFTNK